MRICIAVLLTFLTQLGCAGVTRGDSTASSNSSDSTSGNSAPSITTQPTSQTITSGQTATFSVTASGTAPLTYQWQLNGSPISGATSSSYTTPTEATSSSGAQFSVMVSNSVGNVTSSSATLTVNAAAVAPSITNQPANQTITAGQTATFSVAASGTAPLTYQWQLNGSPISGATSSSYTTATEATSGSGSQFSVMVSNSVGNVTSSSATLTVNAAQSATTTMTISNTVETGGIDRPGINLGGLANYGSQQLFKSLNYASGGYFPGTYAATTYSCTSGGSNTTTTWYNNITDANGYPGNFWADATFVAINAATGTSYGSGTITASTANTGSTGITFTLSPAIGAPCNPSQNDVLIVRQMGPNGKLAPNQVVNNGNICSGASWNTSDTSPSSTNTLQSLQMPTGCSFTFYTDAVLGNRTNTNASLASQQVNFINLNGSYNATFKAKCLAAGCSVNFSVGRVGGPTYLASTTVNPSYSATVGAGWTTYSYPFTASETGTQDSDVGYTFTCNGNPCLIQDADVIEGSTLPGNTTVFRDAVVYELQQLHPGSIRYMDVGQWCSDVADEIAPTGNRRWCGGNEYIPGQLYPPIGYNDVLQLGKLLGARPRFSI
jgi:Immunoglobulin domain/Immunoglobulin I-set domain